MTDNTVTERVKRQRELRAAEGWRKVTVWVPTAADAKDVATWMMTTIELIPGQPSRTPLALCVESQQGARFLESHLLRKLSALHSDRTFQ